MQTPTSTASGGRAAWGRRGRPSPSWVSGTSTRGSRFAARWAPRSAKERSRSTARSERLAITCSPSPACHEGLSLNVHSPATVVLSAMPPDRPDDGVDPQEGRPLPQFATLQDAVINSVDWVIEPCWKGTRVLAHLRDGEVTLTDEDGDIADLDDASNVIGPAIDADQAVIDGAWTAMPFTGEGSAARRWAETI